MHQVAHERAGAVPPLLLVRPDGYVAWATDQPDPAHRDRELTAALGSWCGQQSRQPSRSG